MYEEFQKVLLFVIENLANISKKWARNQMKAHTIGL